MNFDLKVSPGQYISNETLMDKFRCARQGGMRRSLKTNTLVLISDYTSDLYPNAEPDNNGIWTFAGMGTDGDQSIEYLQNKTLYASNTINIDLHLFIIEAENNPKKELKYIGEMLLIDEPEIFYDNKSERNILLFPLIEAGKTSDITDFLLSFDKKKLIDEKIIEGGINYLAGESYIKLIELMIDENIDTLKGKDGWFLNSKGYFYNQYSKAVKWGEIDSLIKKEKMKNSDLFFGQNKYINPYFKDSLVYSEKHNLIKKVELENQNRKFRLKSLSIHKRNEAYNIVLSEDKWPNINSSNKYYTSLFIGPNGTGKSMILSSIQKIFLDLYLLNVSKPIQHTKELDYKIVYTINEEEFLISKEGHKVNFYYGRDKVGLKDIMLPDRVISCAFTVQDRFTSNKDSKNLIDEYQYFGVKNQRFNELTNVLTSNIIEASLTDKSFLYNMKNISGFLNFKPQLKIVLRSNKQNIPDIYEEEFLKKLLKNKKENTIYFNDIVEFWNRNNKDSSQFNKNATFFYTKDSLEIIFDFNKAEIYEEMFEEFEIVKKQIELGMFNNSIIHMKKDNSWFSIEDLSSGEYQYMSNMINILSKIKDSSLILIDEPETSLHPNWQFKYMSVLEEIFDKHEGCHFVMASHSHFMVSDLKIQSSSLIELKKSASNEIVSKIIDESVYARSAEDILYEVFNMPTSRNYYIASDLDEILKAISLNEINDKIKEKTEKLMIVKEHLKENDPLKKLIETINLRVNKNESYTN